MANPLSHEGNLPDQASGAAAALGELTPPQTAPTKREKRAAAKAQRAAEKEQRAKEKAEQAAAEQDNRESGGSPLAGVLSGSTSWMMSLIVHMAVIIVLALMYLPTPKVFDSLLAGVQSEAIDDEIVEVPQIDFDDVDIEIEPDEVEIQPDTNIIEEEISFSPFSEDMAAATSIEVADFGLNTAPETLTSAVAGFDGSSLSGRGHASRQALVRKGGGTAESEDAVQFALAWIAEHQNNDGSWSLDHRGGNCQGRCGEPGTIQDSLRSGTGLALLPFLGAGQTRFEGKYKTVVGRGMDALVRLGQKPKRGNGVSWADGGNMYAHGIAAIAMCEAYGMTKESQLEIPAQAALDYIVSAQNPSGGGWRYSYQQAGDTSVVGWQVMALKSGHLALLRVPRSAVLGADHFLDLVQQDEYGSAYAYTVENKQNYRKSTSAVGLLCRMYLGWKKDNPALVEGVSRIAKIGPSQTDFYHNYYASQLIFQFTGGTGPMWREWNEELRDFLVRTQATEGHEKGSWFVGRGVHASEKGGRLYITAMACMTLEVYYRHMPIYRTDAVDNEFPE